MQQKQLNTPDDSVEQVTFLASLLILAQAWFY